MKGRIIGKVTNNAEKTLLFSLSRRLWRFRSGVCDDFIPEFVTISFRHLWNKAFRVHAESAELKDFFEHELDMNWSRIIHEFIFEHVSDELNG